MALADSKSLLRPGRTADWAKLDAEKRALLAGDGRDSLEERLRRGQRLSAQAARLRRSLVGH